jgi:hypothetical protein
MSDPSEKIYQAALPDAARVPPTPAKVVRRPARPDDSDATSKSSRDLNGQSNPSAALSRKIWPSRM